MFPLRSQKCAPICVMLKVNQVLLKMEIDTGATLSESTYIGKSEAKNIYRTRNSGQRSNRC